VTKLALVTPWPPQHSGIADYAFDLAKVCSRQQVQLVVYTTEACPSALTGVEIISVDTAWDFSVLAGFDQIIYQLGNNTDFHLWMVPLLQDHPGIIHVHDLVMHHMVAWQTWLQGDTEAYLDVLERWYGKSGKLAGERALQEEKYLWDSDDIAAYPLSEEYLQDARGIMVHSQYALEHVRATTPHIPSFQVPQLYDLKARGGASNALRTIVVLGGVDPQKRLDWVIGAVAVLGDRLPENLRVKLRISGNIDPRCNHLVDQARELTGRGVQIEFLGRIDEAKFDQEFRNADLCIALRYPTMGETSAIVSKALQYGIPTVVNDIGWYAELPGHIVKKLPVERCQQILCDLLEYLVRDEAAFAEWSQRCLSFAHTEFSLEAYAKRYLEIACNPRGEEMVSDIFSSVLKECGMTGHDSEDALLGRIINEVNF
jgi:glycosyltransferase involved in cell wall biosynthesis